MPQLQFPKIERFSPYCLLGCLEAVCKAQYGVRNLADCYYNHTFSYAPKAGMRRKAGGLLVDVYFGTQMQETRAKCFSRLALRHGIAVRRREFATFDDFKSYARERLSNGQSFVSYFDLFYLPGRREYHSVHQPHFVSVFGGDPEQAGLQVAEQMLGLLQLPATDLADCFHCPQPLEPFHVFQCDRVGAPRPPSPLLDLQRELDAFLQNLAEPGGQTGLQAFAAFKADVAGFMLAEQALQPFYVPGLWSLSHDRHHFRAALLSFAAVDEPRLADGEDYGALVELLMALHECWLDLDYKVEASIRFKRASLVRAAYARLEDAWTLEQRVPPLLESLRDRCRQLT
jgi:hypothetical protein